MTMYGIRDLIGGQLAVSKDGHGGCGQVHAIERGPSGYAEVTCAGGCEDHLRTDPMWNTQPAEVGETFDERRAREAAEKRGNTASQHLMTVALGRLAGIDTSAITGASPATGGAFAAACPQGHPCPAAAKFCATCGSEVTGAPALQAAGTVKCPDGHESPAGSQFCAECGKPIAQAPARKPRTRTASKPAAKAA